MKVDANRISVPSETTLSFEEAHSFVFQKDFKGRCRMTNWNRGGIVPSEKKLFMLGEGLGSNLGLDGSKATIPKTRAENEEEGRCLLIEKVERAEERKRHRETEKRYTKLRERVLSRKESSGELMDGFRVFRVAWTKSDWEQRAAVLGGLPPGVDVAKTTFSLLVIVPILDESGVESRGFYPNMSKKKLPRDADGRVFWVSPELKDQLSKIFGRIEWSRPLLKAELTQFGVKLDE